MITLVMGGTGSGKSAFAEELAVCGDYPGRYYIATMLVMDEEGSKRRIRHRKSREGKGFETLEIPCRIDGAPELMTDPDKCVVLLECASNLVGNIMHEREWSERRADDPDGFFGDFTDRVTKLITDIAGAVGHLIVVSYLPGENDAPDCDEETDLYLELLDMVNRRLSGIADSVHIL